MFELKLGRDDIKTLLSPEGALKLKGYAEDLNQPFRPSDDEQLVAVKVDVDPSKEIELGTAGSIKLGLKGGMTTELLLFWPAGNTKPLEQFGLQDYFAGGKNSDKFLLLLRVGADVDAGAAIEYKYLSLLAGATIKAGVDGTYAMVQQFQKDTPAKDVLKEFFNGLRLPSGVTEVPEDGEVIQMEYGGYLSLGASLGLGYEVSGTTSQHIRDLNLSEKYRLSLLGKLMFSSKISGLFNIDVRNTPEVPLVPGKEEWVNVKVNKSKNKDFQLAANVEIGADLKVEGMPDSMKDFLEVTLGLKAQNWLNLFEKIKKYTDFNQLDAYLDDLAKSFIHELTGKAFTVLKNNRTLTGFIKEVNNILDTYQNLGDHAVNLFDHYYDPVAERIDSEVIKALDKIGQFNSLDQLKSNVLSGELVKILYLLTDGKPLDWLLGKITIKGVEVNSLNELKQRAKRALSLIKDTAHEEIRKFIILAKSKFPLDGFISQLKKIDLDQLNSKVNQKLTGFVERVIGKSIADIEKRKLGKIVGEVNNALNSITDFSNNLYDKVKESLNQSLKVSLHLGYNRNKGESALLDVLVNLANDDGKRFMKAICRGDFTEIFKEFNPEAVRINDGVLSRQVAQKTTLAFNIVGWHKDFKYRSVTKLLTDSKQHFQTDENGMLTVYTDLTLMLSKDKTKNGERVCTNMILGFVGASSGAALYDEESKRFLVNSITRMRGKYTLQLEDKNTRPEELDHYLSYAKDFGIRKTLEEAKQAVIPVMDKDENGNYGDVSLDYEVRFTEEGLEAILKGDLDEASLRKIIRELTLVNYLNKGNGHLRDLGWCYWTSAIYDIWKKNRLTFPEVVSREISRIPIDPPPNDSIQWPKHISIDPGLFIILRKFYEIEDSIVKGFRQLWKIAREEKGLPPQEYEHSLRILGDVLQGYDSVDESVITFFAVFDAIIKASSDKPSISNSCLRLKALVNDHTTDKMLISK